MSLAGCSHINDFQSTNRAERGGGRGRQNGREEGEKNYRDIDSVRAWKWMVGATFQPSGKHKMYPHSDGEIACAWLCPHLRPPSPLKLVCERDQ